MSENNPVTLQTILQLALPLGTTLVSGEPEITITWAVTVRARPPAFSEIYGGELALVSIELLQTYDSRITLIDVIKGLSEVGVRAMACPDTLADDVIHAANQYQISLLALPDGSNLTHIERAVNATIANYAAQVSQRVLEIQRQLTRLVMENRDIASLLQVLARATSRPILLHDTTGTLIAQRDPDQVQRRDRHASIAFGAFQNWLERLLPDESSDITPSPLGYTAVLRVEKRPAGYLTVFGQSSGLDEFTRMVLIHGADACAVEMAKSRAVRIAVEQARGDWIQMWLSGVSNDHDLMTTRAHQSGFAVEESYVAVVFHATTAAGTVFTLENQVALVRDTQVRTHINGAVGHYVDVIIALYPFDTSGTIERLQGIIGAVRDQLVSRLPGDTVVAGISSPASGLAALRGAYREARDAIHIAEELGTPAGITYYGDLQLFRLLLALKDTAGPHLRDFHNETLGQLLEYDARKDSDFILTLKSYFEANGNLAKAAADLAIHRNTLVYRLERITELTGVNLDDADTRLVLHLALKIQQVLGKASG